jgi:glycerophosphoryl diester phosphodiesterase
MKSLPPKFSRRSMTKFAMSAGMVTVLTSLEARATRKQARPIVIGHRGASADRPEHTLASYREAIAQGADYIEPDLVMTKDSVLVARHENDITGTTNVANHPEFAARKTVKTIDGQKYEGWFVEDFTLAELKKIHARERLPKIRPANLRFSVEHDIPTFDEIIALATSESTRLGRRIGIYPETKHPGYHASLGFKMEEALLAQLVRGGYGTRRDPVFIQSFEVGNLVRLRKMTTIRLIQLMDAEGGPADHQNYYADMLTPAGLRGVATYADGIGVAKSLVIPLDAGKHLTKPTSLVKDAHLAGLLVHAWTFRPENYFLPTEFANTSGATPPVQAFAETPDAWRGNGAGEIAAFLAAGLDGVFADHPADAVAALAKLKRPG